jgi:hypothetical protein
MRKVIKVVCLSLIGLLFIFSLFTNAFVGNPIVTALIGIIFLLLGFVELQQNKGMAKVYMWVSGIVFLLAIFMLLFPDTPFFNKDFLK